MVCLPLGAGFGASPTVKFQDVEISYGVGRVFPALDLEQASEREREREREKDPVLLSWCPNMQCEGDNVQSSYFALLLVQSQSTAVLPNRRFPPSKSPNNTLGGQMAGGFDRPLMPWGRRERERERENERERERENMKGENTGAPRVPPL